MRILITAIKYPGMVGVSTYIGQLVKGLKMRGHHVELFSHNPFLIKNGPNASKTNHQNEAIANYQSAASQLDLAHFDVIHSQGVIPTIALSRIIPPNIPLVSSLHGALTFNMLINGALKKHTPAWKHNLEVESKVVTSSDICIVGSEWLKNIVLSEYQVSANNRLAVIPYGIDITQFSRNMQVQSTIPVPANKFVIACTGRLVPLKGHQYLLQALAKLRHHRKDWICWIIGDGPLRNALQQQVAKLGLRGHVRFLGKQQNVAALLQAADIFAFPSLLDNFPYAVMEAQIAGVPVVATNAGGVPEMVEHGKTGLICPTRNSASLSSQLNKLMNNEQLRELLANNAKKFAIDKFSLEHMIENTISIYHEALHLKNDQNAEKRME